MEQIQKYLKSIITTSISIMLAALLFWLFFLNHVNINEVGIAYDSRNGNITYQTNAGWYYTSPFVKVVNLSTAPIKVYGPESKTVINQKIVKLKVEGLEDLIHREGVSYNLSGCQWGWMASYAFSGKKYPFLEIVQEVATDNYK